MYNGQTKVRQNDLEPFLAAAEELKVKGLTNTNNSSVKKEKRQKSPEPSSSKKPPSVIPKKPKIALKSPSIPSNSSSDHPVFLKSEEDETPYEDSAQADE